MSGYRKDELIGRRHTITLHSDIFNKALSKGEKETLKKYLKELLKKAQKSKVRYS